MRDFEEQLQKLHFHPVSEEVWDSEQTPILQAYLRDRWSLRRKRFRGRQTLRPVLQEPANCLRFIEIEIGKMSVREQNQFSPAPPKGHNEHAFEDFMVAKRG